MSFDNVIKEIKRIEHCPKDEFEIKLTRAFTVSGFSKIQIIQKGINLFEVYTQEKSMTVVKICIEENEGIINFVDTWE